ncbi:MAG TPA: TlpA disulfide reductase family protein [Candidatus Acidoferrum sp.]|jgi:thiol-disulfide isomerase/thioredoxin
MKKTILILIIVAVATAAVYFADKATRVHVSATGRPPVGLKAGASAPDFSVKDLNDKNVSFAADYKGKVVLVNFWATWCTPCQEEIPELIAMQDKYSPKGFTVLGLAMDDEGKSIVAPFVAKERYDVGGQKLPMNYPIVIANDSVAEKFGGLLGYPTSVLIDRNGKVLKRVTGVINEEEISKLIEGAL